MENEAVYVYAFSIFDYIVFAPWGSTVPIMRHVWYIVLDAKALLSE